MPATKGLKQSSDTITTMTVHLDALSQPYGSFVVLVLVSVESANQYSLVQQCAHRQSCKCVQFVRDAIACDTMLFRAW